MDYETKLGAVIKFNSEKEQDIINVVETLKAKHKLGEFISYAIRIALEHPEWFDSKDVTLASFGITDTRRAYFDSITSKIKAMEQKVDTIYNMAIKIYTLAKFGKRIGIEQRAENTLQAGFILQRQLDEISTTLGIQSIGHIYESNKIDALSKKVDELLEYIIDSYDSIVLELKNGVVRQVDLGFSENVATPHTVHMQEMPVQQEKQPEKQIEVDSTQNESSETVVDSDVKGAEELSKDEEVKNPDDTIDFGGGDVDLSYLEGFFQ